MDQRDPRDQLGIGSSPTAEDQAIDQRDKLAFDDLRDQLATRCKALGARLLGFQEAQSRTQFVFGFAQPRSSVLAGWAKEDERVRAALRRISLRSFMWLVQDINGRAKDEARRLAAELEEEDRAVATGPLHYDEVSDLVFRLAAAAEHVQLVDLGRALRQASSIINGYGATIEVKAVEVGS